VGDIERRREGEKPGFCDRLCIPREHFIQKPGFLVFLVSGAKARNRVSAITFASLGNTLFRNPVSWVLGFLSEGEKPGFSETRFLGFLGFWSEGQKPFSWMKLYL
jgi:hypothetical protein